MRVRWGTGVGGGATHASTPSRSSRPTGGAGAVQRGRGVAAESDHGSRGIPIPAQAIVKLCHSHVWQGLHQFELELHRLMQDVMGGCPLNNWSVCACRFGARTNRAAHMIPSHALELSAGFMLFVQLFTLFMLFMLLAR